jgi:pimeloyl-ACP methyl ester carboxylesterase
MIFETSKKTKLEYGIWGDIKSSQVAVFFHGFPGAHIQAKSLDAFVTQNGFCVIAADRPGYGDSTFIKPGDYKSHLQAVIELLDHYQIKKFSVIGLSGGAPMAHLLAVETPDRVENLMIICGLIPFSETSKNHFSPRQQKALLWRKILPSFVVRTLANAVLSRIKPEQKIQDFYKFLAEPDRKALIEAKHRSLLLESMQEARRQKSNGAVWDSALYARNWLAGYNLENFKKFPVYYFHGRHDKVLNPSMPEYMNQLIPHAKVRILEEEGHYSLGLNRAEEMLRLIF